MREGDHFEGLDVDGRIMLQWMMKNWDWGIDWVDLAQDRDRSRDDVNAVITIRAP